MYKIKQEICFNYDILPQYMDGIKQIESKS